MLMRRAVSRVLLEAAFIAALGAVLGLLANSVSPRGLVLTRSYFPSPKASPEVGDGKAGSAPRVAEREQSQPAKVAADATGQAVARMRDKGLAPATSAEVLELFRDPQYEQELIVFVDARNDRAYGEGHVPGAYQFDRYYPEKHLPAVLPACMGALKVVVYCTGGDCEDSEFAALTLIEAGVPAANLRVYAAGFNEWNSQGLPVETGGRHSGQLKGGRK